MLIHSQARLKFQNYILVGALVLCLLCFAVALMWGAVQIHPQQVFAWLFGEEEYQTKLILQSLRLPRALLAASVGAVLAVCGCAAQGLFRNPLADPSLIGVSAGASVGASLAIVFFQNLGFSWLGLSIISISAFAGSIAIVLLVYHLSTSEGGTSVATMLLAGIALTFFAGSFANFLEFIADSHMLRQISLWRMGGLDGANIAKVTILAGVGAIVLLRLFSYSKALDALLLGESEARHLGLPVTSIKRSIIICIAAGVGVSVAMVGTIAFVGLIVPHMVRAVIGPSHQYLMPVSALMGASLLLLSDTIARTALAPTELPVGLITSFIGAPVFILLLRKRYQYSV